MAKPPKDHTSFGSATYFVTASTCGHRSLFQTERMAKLFLNTIYGYRDSGKYSLHEFVLMPNHFHLPLTPAKGVTLDRVMQLIKGGVSYRVGKELELKMEIWERGYVDHRIRDLTDFVNHVEYIRSNPVKAGLVGAFTDYLYSSAQAGFDLDPIPQGLKPGSFSAA
jgi:putative transposase